MGYKFTLLLDRTINGDESGILQEGCAGAYFTTAAHPTRAQVTVTQLDFDAEAPSLAEAITSALEAVKKVPDLITASLSVPPQPNGASGAAEKAEKSNDGQAEKDGEERPPEATGEVAAEAAEKEAAEAQSAV
jgi:hypothetical protein